MRTIVPKSHYSLALVAACAAVARPALSDVKYFNMTPAGETALSLVAMTQNHQVLFETTSSGHVHAWFFTSGHHLVSLNSGPLSTTGSFVSGGAKSMNDEGEIAVTETDASGVNHAAVFTPSRGLKILGTLPAPYNVSSQSLQINEDGAVIGTSSSSTHTSAFVAYQGDYHLVRLALSSATTAESFPTAVNDEGDVVGLSTAGTSATQVFLWQPGQGTSQLNPGLTSYTTGPVPALNSNADAIFTVTEVSGHKRAYIKPRAQNLTPLMPQMGDTDTESKLLNERGDAAFQSYTALPVTHAYLFRHQNGVTSLTLPPPFVISVVRDMNDAGDVVGNAYTPGFETSNGFYFSPSSGITNVGALPGKPDSAVMHVAPNGGAVGIVYDGEPVIVAVANDQTHSLAEILLPGGTKSGLAGASNQPNLSGQIIGQGDTTAFPGGVQGLVYKLFSFNGPVNFNSLIPASAGLDAGSAFPRLLNDAGDVAGTAQKGGVTQLILLTD